MVSELLSSFGIAQFINENIMDAVIAVSGSSPAYVFMFIEAMADAAVAEGMPRAQAYQSRHSLFLEVLRWFSRLESIRRA